IPSEAVIRSGAKSQVFIVRGEGKFEPRLITTGLSSNNEIAVLDGLKEGEEVVTSAQFLIDSESKLHEATSKMMEPSRPQVPEPNRLIMEQGAHQHD
ncbi:MAG: efflux transporter periplasmic adaptor subunit, partial [Methylobacter sp.]